MARVAKNANMICCRPKTLPHDLQESAAEDAIQENPANKPGQLPELPGVVWTPQRIAAITTKMWKSSGVRLTVQFLDTNVVELKNKILSFMNSWGKFSNVQFTESRQGQVRIARNSGDGYWSYLGTDILSIPSNQPTMNLDSFSLSTSDSEYARVVKHETGHTLGFPHEHMRPEIVALIDPVKAKAYFLTYDGWNAQTTLEQVLTPLNPAALTATPPDRFSIMCYQLPAEIMKNGVAIPGGLDIDSIDAGFAGSIYPLVITPPPPPPPQPTINLPVKMQALDAMGKVIGEYKLVQ